MYHLGVKQRSAKRIRSLRNSLRRAAVRRKHELIRVAFREEMGKARAALKTSYESAFFAFTKTCNLSPELRAALTESPAWYISFNGYSDAVNPLAPLVADPSDTVLRGYSGLTIDQQL